MKRKCNIFTATAATVLITYGTTCLDGSRRLLQQRTSCSGYYATAFTTPFMQQRPRPSSSFTSFDVVQAKTSIVLKSFSFIDALISRDEDEEDGDDDYSSANGIGKSRTDNAKGVVDATAFPVPDQTYSASAPFPQRQMAPLPQEQKKKQERAAWVERFYAERGPPPPAPLARPPLVRPPSMDVKTQTRSKTSTSTMVRADEQQDNQPDLQTENLAELKNIWDTSAPITVQGCQSLRTWALKSKQMSAVQVLLRTEGRPLNANVDVWHGPDNTPFKLSVYVEDGNERPFSAIIATPQSAFGSTVAVRNTAETMEFPIQACVQADFSGHGQSNYHRGSIDVGAGGYNNQNNNNNNDFMTLSNLPRELYMQTPKPKTLQGNGGVYVQTYGPEVDKVEILLTTEMRPLQARIEVLQGPNNIKQVMEVFSEDGKARPFYCVLETPGNGNVIRIVNTADFEFPMDICMGPFYQDTGIENIDDDGEYESFPLYALPEYNNKIMNGEQERIFRGGTNDEDMNHPYLSP